MNGKKSGVKTAIIAVACLLAAWIAVGVIDYAMVSGFERPVFCVLDAEKSCQDGGSGTYVGLGYSFDIRGNFMPEDEYPGVTRYVYYIFGSEAASGIRD